MQTYKTYLKIPFVLVVARSNSQGIFVFKITMEKKCTKCGEVKSLDEFSNDKKCIDNKSYTCKSCNKYYRLINNERIKAYRLKYYKKNKEVLSAKAKRYVENNKEKVQIKRKKNYQKHKENIKEYAKTYYLKNKQKLLQGHNVYTIERKKADSLFKLTCNIRSLISTTIKNQGYSKNTKCFNILKCEYSFLIQWLNGLASNNYNYSGKDLNIDHVVPISLAETEDEILLLNHYSNLQLLTKKENYTKGSKRVNPINLKRVLEHHPNPDKIREIHARL